MVHPDKIENRVVDLLDTTKSIGHTYSHVGVTGNEC